MSWKVPSKGVIEFDFVSLRKPSPDLEPLPDDAFFTYCHRYLHVFPCIQIYIRFLRELESFLRYKFYICVYIYTCVSWSRTLPKDVFFAYSHRYAYIFTCIYTISEKTMFFSDMNRIYVYIYTFVCPISMWVYTHTANGMYMYI